MNVAQLTIEMAANVARLKTDMAAARNTVEGTMNSIKKAAGAAQVALGAIGVGLSAAAFANWIKGAINAADEANKLSQKIGIAVKEIGGLQLAFSQGGLNAESMSSSLAKLNKNIAAGDSSFKALGVATKNADGSLRSTTDVLADIADRFAGTENNANKTAMAIDLFGKSGAALIPVLNAGGDSIREFQALAEQLGLTLSSETAAAAEKFNDTLELIGMGSRGIANQVMAELLPTLQSLAGEFLNLMTQGGNLKGIADVISAGLKGLFTVAVVGVEIFRTLGNTIGATAAAIVAFATGDFKGASTIISELGKDVTTNWTNTLASLDRLWNQTGNTAIEAAAKITKGSISSAAATEEAAKAAKKLADEQEKARKAADDLVASIRFETETMQMSNLEREIANNLLKLEKTGLQENTDEYRAYAEAIRLATIENEGIKQRIKLEKEAADKRKKIEEDYAKEVEQINFQIGQSLTDALINGGVTAKEFLINMFKTLILRPILQPIITGGTAAVTSILGMNGTANAATSSSGGFSLNTVTQLGSISSTLSNAWTAALGGLDAIAAGGQSLAFAVGNFLAEAGLETAGMAIFEAAGTIGLVGQGLAGIGAGLLAGNLISGGKALIGDSEWYATGGGTAIGAAIGTAILPGIGTAIGALLGGVVGGLSNAMFGSGKKEFGATGISGTISTTGTSLSMFQDWSKKGGWFGGGGSGTDYQAVSGEFTQFMNAALAGIGASVKTYAEFLGIQADNISQFSQQIRIDLTGQNAEQQAESIAITLRDFNDHLVQYVIPNIGNYAKANETAGETLTRLITNLNNVNATFGSLNLQLLDLSLTGAQTAQNIIDLMGGVEKFQEVTDFYYQNFFTQAERSAQMTENLSNMFAAVNVEMPTTISGFRALVEATSAAGDSQLLANLLQLAPAFLQIAEVAGRTAESIANERGNLMTQLYQATGNTAMIRAQQLEKIDVSNRQLQLQIWAIEDRKVQIEAQRTSTLKRLSDEYDSRVKSINAQRTATEAARQTAQEQVSELTTIFNTLGDAIANITRKFAASSVVSNSLQFIDNALATARTTGYLPSSEDLSNAIAGATGSLGAENFATKFEMERANLVLAGKLQQLQEIGGEQKSVAEKQLEAATRQIEQLDAQLVAEQERYDAEVERENKTYDMMATNFAKQIMAMYSVDSSVQGVTNAVNNMSLQFATYEQTKAAVDKIKGAFPSTSTAMAVAGAGLTSVPWASRGEFSQSGEAGSLNISGYRFEGDQLVSPNGQRVHFSGANPVNKLIELYGLVAQSDGTYIRTRAMGGYTPPGMTLVGENGPELVNFQNPAMVYNSAQTGGIFASGMTEELRGLREDNRAQARALVQLQTRMNRLLERWDGDGIPETREVTA